MVYRGAIDSQRKAYIGCLTRQKILPAVEIMKQCNISLAAVYRIREFISVKKTGPLKCAGGRPIKLCGHDQRKIIRCLRALRKEEGHFSSSRIMEQASLKRNKVSSRTVRRFLHKEGYHYLQARKKGLMCEDDMRQPVDFAKNIKDNHSRDIWSNTVAFYLDGVSFYYKRNPADQARVPQGRIWRRVCEGLIQGCTAKGCKEGIGSCILRLKVAISYRKGVIECHAYDNLNSRSIASFVNGKFDSMFARADKNGSRMFVQDNAPNQNCALVRRILKMNRAKQLCILPRSPDITPIKNFFHLVKKMLRKQALELNITCETFNEFSTHVIRTMYNFPSEVIDKIINTMDGRMGAITGKGQHTKY